MEELLTKHFNGSLKLNHSKVKISRPGSKIKLLGIAILPNGTVSVDGKFKKEAEIGLHYYINNKEKFLNFIKIDDHAKAVKKFSGLINYINTVDPSFLNKLRKRYGATVVDMFIHKSPKL
ncbi:hypothetical protein D3C78_1361870 [compost metagenome]